MQHNAVSSQLVIGILQGTRQGSRHVVASASSHGARTSATHHSSEDHDHHKDSQARNILHAVRVLMSQSSCRSIHLRDVSARTHDSTTARQHKTRKSQTWAELARRWATSRITRGR